MNEPQQVATDLACIAGLGTTGCGFEQPLEAALKALWPSVDIDPRTGEPFDQNRILFVADQNGFGSLGHGDQENRGFVRNDPLHGVSVIAIVVVTDEEDCSSRDTSHFVPASALPPSDPRAQQPLDLRCFFNPQNLFPLERYIHGYKALRPGNENLIVFGAIAGVPPDLVTPERLAGVDFSDDAAREAHYTELLSEVRMQEVIDPSDPSRLSASCNTERGRAFPPRRLVEVARGFGRNGSVQSICQADLAPAIDAIVARIGQQVGAPCLPRPLVRDADGLVGCALSWELPPPGAAPPSTPTQCGQAGFEFLLQPQAGRTVGDRGGAVCLLRQMPAGPEGVEGSASGWYYDDASDEVLTACSESPQRIAFTPDVTPPPRVVVRLSCSNQLDADGVSDPALECSAGSESAQSDLVGEGCLPEFVPEDGFTDSEAYLETESGFCGGGSCLVYQLRGDPREGCVPTAEQSCATAVDVLDRVYCTCRCNAPAGFAECGCPDDFSCVDILEHGSDAVRGGYCVKNGTLSR